MKSRKIFNLQSLSIYAEQLEVYLINGEHPYLEIDELRVVLYLSVLTRMLLHFLRDRD